MAVSEQIINMGLRPHVALWRTTRFELDVTHPLVMGIVNVTPDSFSDGGHYANSVAAISHAETLVEEGAHILDLGAESTRPGATSLNADQEWQRLEPVLKQVMKWDIPVSVDTYHPQTMQKALDLGVDIINDVWAFRQTGALQAVASSGCGMCVMHMHGEPETMQLHPMTGSVMDALNVFFQNKTRLTDSIPAEILEKVKEIPIHAKILYAANEYDFISSRSTIKSDIITYLKKLDIDEMILKSLEKIVLIENGKVEKRIKLSELQVGMIFASDLLTENNNKVASKWMEVSNSLLEVIKLVHSKVAIIEPINVFVSKQP